ncbi:MAG: hypothetical protein NTZ17_08310 [Phycisphaerae bacterium]|nr:hypothetical protein [Phycisphaerae bacterium]
MSDPRDTERLLNAYFASLPTPDGADMDGKILADALVTMQKIKNQSAAPVSGGTWRIIMTSRISKLAFASLVVAAALFFTFFDGFTKPAWALTDAVEALRGFGAVHLIGAIPGKDGVETGVEMWMRANKSRTSSKDMVVRYTNGIVLWVQGESTYTYMPESNTIRHVNAITAGAVHWLGPAMLEKLGKAKNSQVFYGTDPATGRRQATLLCVYFNMLRPQSYSITFDVETKLPIAMTVWYNQQDRRGNPSLRIWQITYYDDLPDSVFVVESPKDAHQVEKELTIPESKLAPLTDPRSGISAEGLDLEQASHRVLTQLYQAIQDGNLGEIRRLCPTVADWTDEMINTFLLAPEQRPAQPVEIRPICKQGQSKLGPLVVVPCLIKTQSGTVREDKMIVQFRTIDGKSSCVVPGPYGLPREIE